MYLSGICIRFKKFYSNPIKYLPLSKIKTPKRDPYIDSPPESDIKISFSISQTYDSTLVCPITYKSKKHIKAISFQLIF